EVDAGLARDRLVDVEELALAVSDGRIGVARGRPEVVAVVERAEPAAVPAARNRRYPARPALRLVTAIQRDRLVEALDQVRASAEQLVVDGNRADDAARAAATRGAEAQEPDDVGEIAVERDVARRAIAAHEGIRRVLARVDD